MELLSAHKRTIRPAQQRGCPNSENAYMFISKETSAAVGNPYDYQARQFQGLD